jgi:FG-GAP-like repeat
MKTKKYFFNHLVLQYHKCSGKLKRLLLKGLNYRKQAILLKRIEKIKQQLHTINHILKKTSAIASIVSGASVLQVNEANAQNFQPAIVNPFQLDSIGNGSNIINSADYGDIDADGDVDIVLYSSSLNKLALIKNIGTPSIPLFEESELIPLSLDEIGLLNKISLGDLDNDGDFDLMCGNQNGDFIYFENIGTDSIQDFSDAIINPFALNNIAIFNDGDSDGDGDTITSLGYDDFTGFYGENFPILVDIDTDGDLDILTNGIFGTYYNDGYGYSDYIEFYGQFYIENIGNNQEPNFIEGVNTNILAF